MSTKRCLVFLCVMFVAATSFMSTSNASAETSDVAAQSQKTPSTGSVWATKRYSQRLCSTGHICPNAQQSLPGSGDGYISSGLQWYALSIYGYGQTGVQGTIYTWQLTTTATLYQNHLYVITDGPHSKYSAGPNDSIQSTAVYGLPPQFLLWSNQADGTVQNSLLTWSDSVIVRQQL